MFSIVKSVINRELIKIVQRKKCDCNSSSFVTYDGDKPGKYKIKKIRTVNIGREGDYKWCGAVLAGKRVYGIPVGFDKVLSLDIEGLNYELIGNLGNDEYKWSGGEYYNGKIYGFPRKSNKLLVINPHTEDMKTFDIGQKYSFEHHYSGVIYKGKLYQPPRNCNHILKINLEDKQSEKIVLSKHQLKFQYCGSILHPNGKIYFLPERNEKVIEFDPEKGIINYIGVFLFSTTFSVCVLSNGAMIGFSGYDKGMLFIDPERRLTKMIHREIGVPGCYKNVLFNDGCVYGMPGCGEYLWKYDPKTDEVTKVSKCGESKYDIAKIASAVIVDDRIIGIPSRADYIYIIEFEEEI